MTDDVANTRALNDRFLDPRTGAADPKEPEAIFERTTGPLSNLTFSEAVEQIRFGDCSRSRMPTDDRDKFAAV